MRGEKLLRIDVLLHQSVKWCSKENLLLITPVLEEEKRIDLRFDCLVTDGFLSLS